MNLDYAAGGALLDAWSRARQARDGDAWVDLFAEGAEYRPDPFSAPLLGRNAIRAYLLETSRDEDQLEITIERHWVVPPTVLAAFHASVGRRTDRTRMRTAGFLVAEVAADGRIGRYREWTERREAPVGR